MSRFYFMTLPLDCILYEMADKVVDNDNKCFLHDIADAYGHIRQMYQVNSGLFSYPCDHNIDWPVSNPISTASPMDTAPSFPTIPLSAPSIKATQATSTLAEKHRERQLMQQQQEHRYALATKYVNKLKSQIGTPGHKESVEILRDILETNLRKYSGDDTVAIHLFGSFASGLCSITSDVDFTIYNFARHYRNPIEELAKALRWVRCQSVTTIANARVPIVSFRARAFDCDMSMDQPMGVLNSKLIATYSKIDDRFI
ncbi:hypothetical protein BGW39_005595 [Mortierella sp. 14UC]|nr:hypothetical protein BGW39_005595 [Mortierella sp. 14UC]